MLKTIRVAQWERYGWLRHAFSARAGGLSTVYEGQDLNLGFTNDDEAQIVTANRGLFLRVVAGDADCEMVTVRQVRGTHVATLRAGEDGLRTYDGRAVLEADGMMTAEAGVMLGIQVADCVPVLLADTKLRVVAAIHAGWRGTAGGIVERGIARMREEFGSNAEDMVGAVGPAIGGCCYTVGDEVREAFTARFGYAEELFRESDDGVHLDLWEANRRQMVGAGLRAVRVAVVGECTACARVNGARKYFSHRAEKGRTGRAMGMIGTVAE